MSTKEWTSKADWDGGSLDDLYCPTALAQLEIAYDILTGKATYIFNAGKQVNWSSFGYTKADEATIWRDDFRANSLGRYTIVGPVAYDSTNKRLVCTPVGTAAGGVNLPASVSVKNVKAQCDFYITQDNDPPWGGMTYITCRYVDDGNRYLSRHTYVGGGNTTRIIKYVGGSGSVLIIGGWAVPLNVWRTHHFDLNNSSLRSWTDEGSMQVNDSDLLVAGLIRFTHFVGQGYMDNILIEHYTLPSPANNSISVRFAISNDNVNWNPWVTDIANCGNSRYIKVEVTLSRDDLDSAMPVLKDMTLGYEARKQQPIFM